MFAVFYEGGLSDLCSVFACFGFVADGVFSEWGHWILGWCRFHWQTFVNVVRSCLLVLLEMQDAAKSARHNLTNRVQ